VNYFKSLLVWIAYLLNFLIDSMASQNPEDWEFPLLEDPIQLSLPSTFRWHLRDEEGPSEVLSVMSNHV
jgi:hypothetical protein